MKNGQWICCRSSVLGGRWFRVLTVVDQFTRECLLLLADRSLTGHKVALTLAQIIAERSAPVYQSW
jgi:putative transposase